jgi:hypothetical protein
MMDILESILDLLPIPTIGILIALIYYIIAIRTQNKTRQAQLYMQFLNPILSGEKSKAWHELQSWEWDDYDDFMQNYWSKEEKRETWSSLSGYFEGLGVYVRESLVPIRLVALTMTGMLTRYWNKFGPIIKEYRIREDTPRNLSETEYLYNELMKYLERHPEFKS